MVCLSLLLQCGCSLKIRYPTLSLSLFNSSHPISLLIYVYFIYQLFLAVVSQFYITEAENEYVIKGNAAVVKCKIPSFVADFVQIEAWVDEDGVELWRDNATAAYGTVYVKYID